MFNSRTPIGTGLIMLAVLGSIAGLIASVAGCSHRGDSSELARTNDPVPVTIATATQQTVPSVLNAIGAVQPYSTVSIKAQVEGELTDVHFKEGQEVTQGDLLFTIDPRPFQARVAEAEANLARDVAKQEQADAEEHRYAYMATAGIGSKERDDQAHADAGAARANVRADQAALRTAKLNLEYTSIHSPIDGRTGNLVIKRGNLIKAHDDTALITINQVHPIYVDFSIPERYLDELRTQMARGTLSVRASAPHQEGGPELGMLTFVDNTVDRATGTIDLKATFDNKSGRLWPGQFVDVTVTVAQHPNAILVPTQAVQTGQHGQFVFVVAPDQSVQPRPVTTGESMDGKTIIQTGIARGETVVTDGQLRLTPGSRITIKPAVDSDQSTT
jgi:multidrug efflux system membrane fusion protein